MAALKGDGIILRFFLAMCLVFASYNPSGYSYYHWIRDIVPHITSFSPYMAISGVALVIGWVIYVRATFRSLGVIGICLFAAVAMCIVWLLFEWGWLNLEAKRPIVWMTLVLISSGLTVGMCWSHIRRMMSGQIDADDVDIDN